MTTYIPWEPVGKYGCGDPYGCPTCTPHVQLEREIAHRRRVSSTWPRSTPADQVSAFMGEVSGTAGERAFRPEPTVTKAERALARAEADEGAEAVRVKRSLTAEQRAAAHDYFEAYPTRHSYYRLDASGVRTRHEWQSEVWLELVNPTALVARREGRFRGDALDVLKRKVLAAVSRGQARMRQEAIDLGRDRAMGAGQ